MQCMSVSTQMTEFKSLGNGWSPAGAFYKLYNLDIQTVELTRRQRDYLEYIIDFIGKKGYPPTIQELADHFKCWPNAADDHVKALCKKGYLLKSKKGSVRAYKVVKK